MPDTPAAGCRALDVLDPVQGARVPVHVLYPAREPAARRAFGPYALEAAFDAPVSGERLPLVAMSHGTGGTPWGLLGLATHLARAGFAVALLEHPGNSRRDDSLAGTPQNLANRPRHVRLALDAAFADPVVGPHLLASTAAVIGHSLGGYTALAIGGGRPIALPDQTPDGVAHPVPVEPDPRIAAIVLLAPAIAWFMAPGALAGVRAPLLVRLAERDPLVPPEFVDWILRGLPAGARVDRAIVAGGGHFAWFWPVPAALAGLLPAQDPPGFDRAAYQPRLHAEVTAFLRGALEAAR